MMTTHYQETAITAKAEAALRLEAQHVFESLLDKGYSMDQVVEFSSELINCLSQTIESREAFTV